MLPVRDPNYILDEVASDPSFTEADRGLIADQLERIANEDAELAGGGPRLGLPRWTTAVQGSSPPITITFEIASPTVYPANRAGVWLIDISRLRS